MPGKQAAMAKTLGVGIVGTGWVSGEHIRAFERNPHTKVVGILSRERARAAAKAKEHGLERCQAYTDLDKMLADDEIRIISICTPHHLHVEQGVAGAEAGKHLLVEKPIAIDLDGLRRLDQAVRRAGVKSVVSFVLRWNPLFENIKAVLADNLIGRIFYGEVDYLHAVGPMYPCYAWIREKRIGANTMLTAGCHAVDGLRWFVGGEVVEIFAYANTSASNKLNYEYEPNSLTLLRFADGTIAKVGCSIECNMPYAFNILLMGDEGTIRNNQIFTNRWPGQTGWATVPTILPDSGDVSHHPFSAEVDHLVDCILHDRESHCNIADSVKTHEICLAAEISTMEKRPVPLPLP
jgi:predicted dehydrogenase